MLLQGFITKLLGSLFVLPFFFISGVASAQMAEELPLVFDREGRLLASVKVDKYGDYPFLLDTAASRTLLAQSLQQDLGLRAHTRQQSSVTANGSYQASLYYVGTLWLGKIRMPMGYIGATPGHTPKGLEEQYHGIVGGNIWRSTMAEFNIDDERIRFYQPGTELAEEGWLSLKTEQLRSGLFMVKLMIEGEEVSALFDTGANSSVLNRPAARAVGLEHDGRLKRGGRVYDGSQISAGTSYFIADDILLAGKTLNNHKLFAADLGVFRSLNIAGQPAMILGMDILGHYNFIIDLPGGRVLMRPRKG